VRLFEVFSIIAYARLRSRDREVTAARSKPIKPPRCHVAVI